MFSLYLLFPCDLNSQQPRIHVQAFTFGRQVQISGSLHNLNNSLMCRQTFVLYRLTGKPATDPGGPGGPGRPASPEGPTPPLFPEIP